MTATIHRLSAGDGYTYLTRQVAAADATTLGHGGLADYYSEKGERPGVWYGQGVANLQDVLPGDTVTEEQMRALFGEGLQPNADQIMEDLALKNPEWGSKKLRSEVALGRGYALYQDAPLTVAVREAYRAWNVKNGREEEVAIDPEIRDELRTQAARELFVERYDRDPIDAQELTGFVAREGRKQRSAVAGFDVTFSPVKSVSALWAVADRETSEEIAAAHDAAVTNALEWMQTNSVFTRDGLDGVAQVETQGMIATRFTHRDTRAGDPDLHTHVAIANRVQNGQGEWRTLDGRMMYRTMVAASERYNSALETELNTRLGLSFAAREEVVAEHKQVVREVDGMDPALLESWSSRQRMIEVRGQELAGEFLEQHGRVPSPSEMLRLRQQANLETREAKHEPRSESDQRAMWRDQASEILGGEQGIAAMLQQVEAAQVHNENRLSAEQLGDLSLQSLRTIQHKRAEFSDTHLIAEAERRVRAAKVDPEVFEQTVAQLVKRALGDEETVQIKAKDSVSEPAVLRRSTGESIYHVAHSTKYTTQTQLLEERSVVAAAQLTDGAVVREETLGIALLESVANGVTLNDGQVELVRSMATSGQRVQLALAPAGSGKTTAMDVLGKAWQSEGGTVVGLAPSAAAAEQLGASMDIQADTLAQLVHRLDHNRDLPAWARDMDDKTLLVIDEAGMASTHDLAVAVAYAVGKGASVRLVGDDQQLASVASGGVLRDIQAEVGAVSLREALRFRDQGERRSLEALRDGDVQAIGFYLDRQRIHVSATGGVLDQVFSAWHSDQEAGLDTVMLAYRNADVNTLNGMARAARLAASPTAASAATVALASGLEASVGDLVITRHNDRDLRTTGTDYVKNGNRWWLAGLYDDGSVAVRSTTTGAVATLPADYVSEHVDLGYATTIHASQGSTVDTTHVVIDGSENRQLLYVAMSRGRRENHVYLDAGVDGDEHNIVRPEYVEPLSPVELLEAVVTRDGSHQSATTQHRIANDPTTLLGRDVARYADATGALAVANLSAERREHITREADKMMAEHWAMEPDGDGNPPRILSGDPGWNTLLQRLAIIEATGTDSLPVLHEAITSRELDTAENLAVVIEWRIAGPSSGGPVPWLAGVPEGLPAEQTTYLTALSQQTHEWADEVRQNYRDMPADQLPGWAKSLQAGRDLVADIGVWRAGRGIDDAEVLPTGPRAARSSDRRYQRRLDQRIEQAQDISPDTDQRWNEVLVAHDAQQISDDPYWAIVSRRLTLAARSGEDVATILEAALADPRPLPVDHAAAAVWFRIAPQVEPIIEQATERPSWDATLRDHLAPRGYRRLVDTPQWSDIVTGIDTAAQREAMTPDDVVRRTMTLIGTDTIGTDTGLTYDQLPDAMLHQLEDLSRPVAPATVPDTLDETLPVDAANLETRPTAADEAAARAMRRTRGTQPDRTQDRRGTTTPPDEAEPQLSPDVLAAAAAHAVPADLLPLEEPMDPEQLPPDTLDQGPLTVAAAPATLPNEPANPEQLPPDPATEIPEAHSWQPETTSRERIVELTTAAADFYGQQYRQHPTVAGYVAHRLGTDLTDQPQIAIGYAPAERDALIQHLRHTADATPDELVDAGLAKYRPGRQVVDVFRDRLTFGIHDPDGDLVGFTARAHPGAAPEVPKYLNTPSTAAFTKGAQLFGAHEGQAALDQGAVVARVEGPMDALAITLAGNGRAVGVAPMGTALTDAQADRIAQLSTTPTMLQATDTDRAGMQAAAEDYTKLTSRGLLPHRLVLLDTNDLNRQIKDPADAYRADPATLTQALAMPELSPTLASTLISERITQDRDHLDMGSVPAIVAAARDAAQIITALPPSQWEDHIETTAAQLPGGADTQALLADEVLLTATTATTYLDRTVATETQAVHTVAAMATIDPDQAAIQAFLERAAERTRQREQRQAAAQPTRADIDTADIIRRMEAIKNNAALDPQERPAHDPARLDDDQPRHEHRGPRLS